MSILLKGAVDAAGDLQITNGTASPNHVHNGIPYESDGSLAVDLSGAITHYHQGLAFTATGRLASEITAIAPNYAGSGGAVFTAANRSAFAQQVISLVMGGVGYTTLGAVATP